MKMKLLIAALVAALCGTHYGCYWYGEKKATQDVVDYLSYMCSKGAVVQDSSGGYFMCTPANMDKQEKKKLDNNA